MTDEITAQLREAVQESQKEKVGEAIPTGDEALEAQPTEIELKAAEAGWHKGGKDKDGNELSPDEFLARKPLFNKIHTLNDDIHDLKDMVKDLQNDNKAIATASVQKQEDLMNQLKAAKEQALNDLDTDKVRQIDGEIDKVRDTITENAQPMASKQEWEGAYSVFLKDNAWYDDKPGLAKRADMIARNIMEADKSTAPSKLYTAVSEQIREEFPERFIEKPEGKTNKVGTSNNRGTRTVSKKQVRLSDLDEETRRVVKTMMDATGKSEEEYLKTYEL